MEPRASGVLLHITCLPSAFGIGDLGPWAYRFADFLASTKQSYWQVLPLTPTAADHHSPYNSPSAFAGNVLLLSPERLVEQGFLGQGDLEGCCPYPVDHVDFPAVVSYKARITDRAYDVFRAVGQRAEYERFCRANAFWLEEFALFTALGTRFEGRAWTDWPVPMRDRERDRLEEAVRDLHDAVEKQKFSQYLFFRQWQDLKDYCNEKGVHIIGDLPVYVDFNSADVWTHPEFFRLDQDKRPHVVAGVPPDYFSATGQRWGNPLYDWKRLAGDGYCWWMDRMRHNLQMYDLVRIDHFRGFAGYWEIPASEPTAVNGRWVQGPGHTFFKTMLRRFPRLPVIAEDLGMITPDVRELMASFGFPGMKVLLFAFGEDLPSNPYAPHNIGNNSVVFTGTHDNNTVRGWFDHEASPQDRARLFEYLGHEIPAHAVHWEMIRLAMLSAAHTVLIPLQDILGLGQEARMNLPARKDDNWRWRLWPEMLTEEVAQRLKRMTQIYGRD